jgi:hypothetical protein
MMGDEEFLAALEDCSLSERQFGHAAHVRAAYLYSRSGDVAAALAKTRRAIQAFATSLGKADRYHETITVAYLALIRQALFESGDGGGWTGFAQANARLLEQNVLLQFYTQSQLNSELARRVFLLPRSNSKLAVAGTVHAKN